ncbi:MAG: [FeFe] hydrogenase H-cluster radical SAM maturase HydE [Lachnospiraceae bacterium]|nr:[FeFe] hydrogenase H-cluster radical SAM maturase HydE [Lachnospiraceae bacterium]
MYRHLVDELSCRHTLCDADMRKLISNTDDCDVSYLMEKAREAAGKVYGKDIYIRGLIEISNYCRNNCYYCGIRRGNDRAERYRLTMAEIRECIDYGYQLGFRTFVLQGGEDAALTDDFLTEIIGAVKTQYDDCAITLSIGERTYDSYVRLYDAGADRYLLRHETADSGHYGKLHPADMSYENRIKCLMQLKEIGYQTGCGMMIGSPYQTVDNIIKDIRLIERLKPHMVGLGPFIPHKDTQFADYAEGSAALTLKIMSVIRIMQPDVLLPSTTALETIVGDAHKTGILAGCNVIMPNLSPEHAKEKYMLYNNKAVSGSEDASGLSVLRANMESIGYNIVTGRGDCKRPGVKGMLQDV